MVGTGSRAHALKEVFLATRVGDDGFKILTRSFSDFVTDSERVSSETFETIARWVVVVSLANRIGSANSGTWVFAFILYASSIAIAVIVGYAFGFAANVWVTKVFG